MTDRWIPIAVLACIVAIAAFIWHAPRCKPGDPGLYIGGRLVAGCPTQR